ncbi:MAG: VCBS repeat-containing protein, partial [Nitrospirae bacterium]|nr:VCBS repeat-containing protein [Nitrospirota bacterium]
GDVTVKTSTNTCQWTATSGVDWITVTSGSAVTGSGVVSYSVAANTGPLRTGTITIGGQTFTVNQAGVCKYTLTPTSKQIGGSGGTDSVNVTAASACSWSAISNDTWITITSGSSGSGNGSVYYSVDANPTANTRTGTLTIADQTFTVTQLGVDFVTLTLKITGNGSGTVTASKGTPNCSSDGKTCLTSYAIGTDVILTATPAQGSTLKGWTGCNPTVTGGSQCTVTMSKDMDVSVEFSVPVTPIYDFDGDGKSDVIWRSSQSGDVFIWLMNKFSLTGGDYVVKGITAAWDIKGIADFNGDGKNDIVWQHKDKG